MTTLAIVIFVVMAIFTAWFVPWYHQRDPAAVIRYVPRIAASAAFLGIIVLLVRLQHCLRLGAERPLAKFHS
jgi:uncharacterized membrane protein YcfT